MSGVLEGYNLLDMVKVDYMAGRLHSKHPVVPPTDESPDEPTITPVGSHYGKIVVAGFELTPVMDSDFFNSTLSYTDLCKKIAKDPKLRARFNVSEDAAFPPARGMLVGSIVPDITGGGPGLTIERNTVHCTWIW